MESFREARAAGPPIDRLREKSGESAGLWKGGLRRDPLVEYAQCENEGWRWHVTTRGGVLNLPNPSFAGVADR